MAKRSAQATKERILEATAHEMATSGLDGVRIEAVAARANCNKALIYRYFQDRETLFLEAFRHQLAGRLAVLDRLPEELASVLHLWVEQTLADQAFIRLMLREAIDYEGGPPVEEEARQAYYARQIEMVRAYQRQGKISADLDSEMLFLALLSLIALPALLPQVVYLASGLQSDSPEFKERWNQLLTDLADRL